MINDLNNLHIEITGTGNLLLLLHGFAGSARNWRNLTKAVNSQWQTLCYDLPGHGRSSAPHEPEAYYLDAQLKLIDQLLAQQTQSPAVIGGLSMGAGLAFHYALQHPEKLRGLILASFPSGSRYQGGIKHYTQSFADAIDTFGKEAAGEQFVWNKESGFNQKDSALIRLGFLGHSAQGLSFSLRYLLGRYPENEQLLQLARQIKIPTLILAGSLDTPALELSQQLAKQIPQAKLEIIENGGHLINIDSATVFNAKILGFLNSL